MTPELVLFLLRLLGAALLLAFLGVIAWLIYQDMRMTAAILAEQQRQQGFLRVIAAENGNLAVDTLLPLMSITSIGRATSNTIVLDDHYTSSEHVLITRRSGQWWLEDLNSRNGTLLNNVPLQGAAAVVSAGDIITIGNTQLKIEF
jgi:hypothetical protein